jgi:two-component system OmpR family sensor kinase
MPFSSPDSPRWSVRVRILAAILLVTSLGMIVAGATAYFVQRDRALQDIDSRLLASIEAVRVVVAGTPGSATSGSAEVPSAAGFASPREALAQALARVLPDSNESSLGIVNGVPAYVSAIDQGFHLEDDRAFVDRVVSEVSDGSVRVGTAVSSLGTLRYIASPITVEGVTDEGIFVTAYDLEAELEEVTAAFTTYAIVAGAAIVVVGVVGWFVAGRLLAPIRNLRETASRITAADIKERIPVRGNDDVSELTRTVNDMLERIESSLTAQQQLLDDVRHELKTPLTIVHGHLEVLDPTRPEEVAQTRALVLDELDRMYTLVDDIESLADSGEQAALQRIEADVAELASQVFAKASAIGDHEWSLETVASGTAWIDPSRITQAWLQLADNAAKYSPEGSPIVLGCTRSDDSVEFWVADRGPGIPPGLEERIFDRFGRVDTGRGIRGSGLGLAIVKAIAHSHGGRVTLASSSLGSRFGITVPAGGGTQ